jgi:hypothetical protein
VESSNASSDENSKQMTQSNIHNVNEELTARMAEGCLDGRLYGVVAEKIFVLKS